MKVYKPGDRVAVYSPSHLSYGLKGIVIESEEESMDEYPMVAVQMDDGPLAVVYPQQLRKLRYKKKKPSFRDSCLP